MAAGSGIPWEHRAMGCNHELCQHVFCFSPCPCSPQGNSRNWKAVTLALQEESSLPAPLLWLKGHSFCCPAKRGVLHLGLFPSSLLLFIVFVAPHCCRGLSKMGKKNASMAAYPVEEGSQQHATLGLVKQGLRCMGIPGLI